MTNLVIKYEWIEIDGIPGGTATSNIGQGHPYYKECSDLMESYIALMEKRNQDHPGTSGKLELELD